MQSHYNNYTQQDQRGLEWSVGRPEHGDTSDDTKQYIGGVGVGVRARDYNNIIDTQDRKTLLPPE